MIEIYNLYKFKMDHYPLFDKEYLILKKIN